MRLFKVALEGNSLYDLGRQGDWFTWSNKHYDDTFTKEKLDIVFANNSIWISTFRETSILAPTARYFDHKPICISMHRTNPPSKKRVLLFRYEASWAKQEGFV